MTIINLGTRVVNNYLVSTEIGYILDREGFEYCGQIQFDGGLKLAYEWDG